MIGRLRGRVIERGLDGSILLEVGGVGYEVFVPIGALGSATAPGTSPGKVRSPDAELVLHVHTHAREDALTLYGFATAEDKLAFRALLGVSSVGPKLAMSILGTLDAPALARAIQGEDRAALKGISGVGKKTVERLFLDLKDKLAFAGPLSISRPAASAPPPAEGPAATVVGALVQMGYKRPMAERAVEHLEVEGKPIEVLLREALAALA